MVNKKFEFKTIDIIQKTVIIPIKVWSVDDITKSLRKIERVEDFKGFTEIHFVVGEFPKISYYTGNSTKEKISESDEDEDDPGFRDPAFDKE